MESVQLDVVSRGFRLQEIIGGNGKGIISSWLAKFPGSRARFSIRLRNMRMVPRVDWTPKQFRNLGGGLSEIKWEFENKQWRAIGFDFNGFFVLICGCTHKGKVYDPADCLKTSKQRKKETESGAWGIGDYEP